MPTADQLERQAAAAAKKTFARTAYGPNAANYRPPTNSRPPSQQVNKPTTSTPGLGSLGYSTSWKTYEDVAYKDAMNKLQSQGLPGAPASAPPPRSGGGGSGGGGWGGGGGGGGGGLDPAAYSAYAAQMMKVIQGMKAPVLPQAPAAMTNPLTGMINPAVDKDIATARDAYGRVAGEVSMEDPYLALISRQAQHASPELQALADSQGVGADYATQVGLNNQDADQSAANWSQLAQILGKNHLAGQQDTLDTTKLQGENVVSGFEGQRTQLQALASLQQMQLEKAARDQAFQIQQQQAQLDAQNKQAQLQALMELLGTGLQYGKNFPDISGVL